ncbi:4-hydroxyacetophenone monooxygenase [Mycolicibacterium rhodesiae JS60]|nr:4-hydroxyacetophenone monooxygenase [Mycolicibacterium rhodesiae JS60]
MLDAAVAKANIPTLLMVLVQLTGDLHWLEPPYCISRTKGMADNDSGGLSDDLQAQVRSAALAAIKAWRAGAPVALPQPSPELMARMLSVSMGENVPSEYGDVLAQELAAGVGNAPEPHPVNVPEGFRAVIIGAGISGIAAAIRMAAMNIPFVVLEKNAEVGGVWLENTYPGAGVDTPSHLYSYSFAPGDWPHYFASRDEVQDYLARVTDDFALRKHIRFESEVLRADFDEAQQVWTVQVRDRDGATTAERADVIISCVGAFNPPVVPPLPGLQTFAGPAFHTARWPSDLVIEGKKVAVVGNGASAMQVVPAIADVVDELTIFQRSPQWVQPFDKFKTRVPESMRLLFDEVPLFRAWYRLRLSWIYHDKLYGALQRDPAWADSDVAINSANDGHRKYFTDYIKSKLPGRDDLWDKTIPNYPPFGKRMLQDNGWFTTLLRPNVHLVTDAITEIRPAGVVTESGDCYDADVLVLATGFDVVRFLSSFEVRGRGGRLLSDVWNGDDGRAYLGLTIPGFPNFFTLYGPNTQTGHGGSLIHTVECQLQYLDGLLRMMFGEGLATVECREEVYDQYAATVDEMHEQMIWTHPAMSTYYRNARGRVVVINPFRNVDFWRMTRHPDLDDYLVEYRDEPAQMTTAQ